MKFINKKHLGFFLILNLTFLSFTGCQNKQPEESTSKEILEQENLNQEDHTATNEEEPEDPENAEFEALKQKYNNFLSLTKEQRKEDFDYLWNTLKESYPFWGVVERENGDMDWLYDNYLEGALENDVDFYIALNSMMYLMGGAGHLSLIEPDFYNFLKDDYAEEESRAYWHETLNNAATAENYPKFAELMDEIIKLDEGDYGYHEDNSNEQSDNVTAFILPGSKIAYLRVDSFSMASYEKDKEIILNFYESIDDCTELIIDITSNSGGGDPYWHNLLVAPHITKPLSTTNIALVRQTEHSIPYLEQEFSADDILPIDQLPELPNLPAADKELMTGYINNTITVEPSKTPSPFSGDIYVLVSEQVYSSSEAFTVFCKQTGFATLVGNTTGGDGIGIDPAYIALPNSGFLFRYSMLYGINEDGACNEEYGTTPDILSFPDENPLVTVLRALVK